MTLTQLTTRQFKTLVKESVKEVLVFELMKLRAAMLPFISEKEQKDIERRYQKPSRRIVKTHTVDL